MQKLLLSLLIFLCASTAGAVERQVPSSNEEVMLSFSPLVKKASPAVVNIYTKKKVQVRTRISPFLNDPVFKQFFGNSFGNEQVTERIESSLGSGVIVRDDGLIITNHHVIDGSTDITVVLSDRREFPAKIKVDDVRTDLALLKMDLGDQKVPYLELMDSDELEVGDMVMAIGNPFGVGQTVTNGIVSAVARTTVGTSDYEFFIQTDAAINPGNSGGALINMQGKLAGINSAIFTKSGGSNGIGFAIPSNMVATIIRSDQGEVIRPWLGMSVQPVSQEIANSLGLDRPVGAIVAHVYPEGPSAKAGIKVGDIVMAVDKHEILDDHALHFRSAMYEIGQSAEFSIMRNGKTQDIKVEMVTAPENPKRDLRKIDGVNPLSGSTLANLSPALADEIGFNVIDQGVIVFNMSVGIAPNIGFKKNDIIKKINGHDVESSKQAEELLKEKNQKWEISLQRGNRLLNIIWTHR